MIAARGAIPSMRLRAVMPGLVPGPRAPRSGLRRSLGILSFCAHDRDKTGSARYLRSALPRKDV